MFTQIYRALYGDAMLELIRMSSSMADGNNRNICYRVLLQSVNLLLEELIDIKVILFPILELQNSSKKVTFLI